MLGAGAPPQEGGRIPGDGGRLPGGDGPPWTAAGFHSLMMTLVISVTGPGGPTTYVAGATALLVIIVGSSRANKDRNAGPPRPQQQQKHPQQQRPATNADAHWISSVSIILSAPFSAVGRSSPIGLIRAMQDGNVPQQPPHPQQQHSGQHAASTCSARQNASVPAQDSGYWSAYFILSCIRCI